MTLPEGLLTKNHLAELLKIKPRTIDKYTKLGMPHVKIGDLTRYGYEEVLDWLRKREEVSQ